MWYFEYIYWYFVENTVVFWANTGYFEQIKRFLGKIQGYFLENTVVFLSNTGYFGQIKRYLGKIQGYFLENTKIYVANIVLYLENMVVFWEIS